MNYVREFRETDEPDCKTCGACCIGKSADGDFVPVTALDRRRLPTKYVKKLQDVEPEEDGVFERAENVPYAFGLKRFGAHEACVALKGTLGKDVACDIYDVRPAFCRSFERGSDECRTRRRELFFIKPAFKEE